MYQLPAERALTWELEYLSAGDELAHQLPVRLQPIVQPLGEAALAERVTAPAVETSDGELLRPAIANDRELLSKALSVHEALDADLAEQVESLRSAPPANKQVTWRQLEWALKKTERGDWSLLESCALRVNRDWFQDIVRSMLRNRPVEVEVAHARRPHVTGDTRHGYSLNYDQQFTGQEIGLHFAAMLRRVNGFEYARPVVPVDDLTFSNDWFAVSALHRQQVVGSAYCKLTQAGAIGEHDQPGQDFVIVPDSRSAVRVDELVERLREAQTGLLVPGHDGSLHLRPGERIQQITRAQYATAVPELYRRGVPLKAADGTPTPVAIQAAGYLDPVNARFTHLRLHDTHLVDLLKQPLKIPVAHQELSIVLQSLGVAHPDRDHYIDYDHRLLAPEHAVYALTRLLRNEVATIARSLGELDAVEAAMIPSDYFDHNYKPKEPDAADASKELEKQVWPEDVQGTQAVGAELPLHFVLGEVASAAVIGYGPFSYPALAIAPYMRPGAVIDISDLLPSNIAFAEQWFNGAAQPSLNKAYQTFGDLFRSGHQTGRFYANCEEQLRTAGRLRVAALEDLESDSAQVVLESFVSCSNNIEKYGFIMSLREKARIMTWTPHSMVISVHMVGSGGWNNSGDHEGIKIPAAKLSMAEIENGYRSVGLRIVNCTPLHADVGIREDYKGMVVIFAKPDMVERPWSLAA